VLKNSLQILEISTIGKEAYAIRNQRAILPDRNATEYAKSNPSGNARNPEFFIMLAASVQITIVTVLLDV